MNLCFRGHDIIFDESPLKLHGNVDVIWNNLLRVSTDLENVGGSQIN